MGHLYHILLHFIPRDAEIVIKIGFWFSIGTIIHLNQSSESPKTKMIWTAFLRDPQIMLP